MALLAWSDGTLHYALVGELGLIELAGRSPSSIAPVNGEASVMRRRPPFSSAANARS